MTGTRERHTDGCWHPLDTWGAAWPDHPDGWDYCYTGHCPRTGQVHALPRTALAKAVAHRLMQQMAQDPQFAAAGKMYGVLLVQTAEGQVGVLKAFSGLWRGQRQVPGWVPPIPGREQVAWQEATTLDQLNRIKTRLLELQHRPERETYARLVADLAQQRQALNHRHRYRREQRATQRQQLTDTLTGADLAQALAALDQASRGDKAELKRFKHRQAQVLDPLVATLAAADQEIQALKRQRQALSQQLQTAMHAVYTLTNFAGESLALQALRQTGGLPTGTGDCCAPKLLHYAAQHQWQPLALAEFWWGPALGDKQPGQFYGACAERCQPMMGFLLAGLSVLAGVERDGAPIPILYADEDLVVVDKPAGLLSVPGRYSDRQDSVLTRLQPTSGESLRPVHRLDQDTSGLLLVARTVESHRHLSQQFEQRQVGKIYEAIVEGSIPLTTGQIDLPLWGDPTQRPRQGVDWQRGKPSHTQFEVITALENSTRLKLMPLTGRTHQLRVHAAHPQGLKAPIRGDRLYGQAQPGQRLHLHATELSFSHPRHLTRLTLRSPVPF